MPKNAHGKSKSKSHAHLRRRKVRKVGKRTEILRYLGVFTLFLISSTFLVSYIAYKNLNLPFARASFSAGGNLENIDIVTLSFIKVENFDDPLRVEGLMYVIFDKKAKKTVVYEIPVEGSIDVPGKYGVELFSNILALGMLDSGGNINTGASLLNDSVTKLFGYKVDRFLLVSGEVGETLGGFLGNGSSFNLFELANINKFKTSVKTNLSFSEFYNLYEFINSLPSDRFIHSVFDMNLDIDEEIQDMTFDSEIALEKKTVSILNGTPTSGLASFSARVMKNMSIHVINVGNARDIYSQTVLIVDSYDSKTGSYIAEIFSPEEIILKEDMQDLFEEDIIRADITLILGLDNENKL